MFETEQYIFLLENEDGESCEYSFLKNRFLSQCNPSNQKEYNYYLKYSKIFCNKTILKCKYSESIEASLKSLVETKKIHL